MIHPKTPNESTVKQSPWLVGEQRFSRISDQDQISHILKGIRDNNLFVTIAAPDGQNTIFFDSFLLDIKKEQIRLYRSSRWQEDNKEDFFRVFFRNSEGCWHVFKAIHDRQDSHSIAISTPKTIYVLKHRNHDRLEPPLETRATFSYANKPSCNFQVINISNSGMLIRSCEEDISLPIFSRLKDIDIDLPDSEQEKMPTIKKAQVIRRFRTDEDNILCYGILFMEDCKAGEEIIWNLISKDGNC